MGWRLKGIVFPLKIFGMYGFYDGVSFLPVTVTVGAEPVDVLVWAVLAGVVDGAGVVV